MSLSLFAGLRGQGAETTLDIAAAVMVPIVAAMLADGRVEEDELLQIEAICVSSPIFDRNSATENELLILRVTHMIEDHGIQAMCERARSLLSPALRETAFIQAVRVIFSDGHVGLIEREVVENMIGWLAIDPSRARSMIEVVSIMQHPVTA